MPKYINADEFLQKVQKHHYILRSFDNSKDFGMFDCGIKRVVDEMPSADVRENIHGVWIYDIDGIDWGIGCWKCSLCNARNENIHEENKFSANPLKWAGSNFCPNCGADMRRETK